jgi:Yip1 domain
MSMTNPEARTALIERVKAILLKPKEEWVKIEAEQATTQGLYTHYILILAALPVICRFLGSVIFGYSFFGVTYRPGFVGALGGAIVQYVLSLVGVFILALIIDALASTFNGQKSQIQALKLAAYSWTAAWLAGCFALIPAIGMLSILGLYSLYLLYVGVPILMKAPQDKAFMYTGAVIVCAIVLSIIISLVAGMMMPHPSRMASSGGTVTGQLKLPGGGSVDMGALQQAANNLQAAASGAASSGSSGNAGSAGTAATAIDTDKLKTLLPGGLSGGFSRGDITTGSGGLAGISGSGASATYTHGNDTIDLSVTDLGALGAMASMTGLLGANASEQSATHYSKTGRVNGRQTMEEYDSAEKSGTYAVIVANRVMVSAEGHGADMGELKSAVGRIDLGKIERLAKQ